MSNCATYEANATIPEMETIVEQLLHEAKREREGYELLVCVRCIRSNGIET